MSKNVSINDIVDAEEQRAVYERSVRQAAQQPTLPRHRLNEATRTAALTELNWGRIGGEFGIEDLVDNMG